MKLKDTTLPAALIPLIPLSLFCAPEAQAQSSCDEYARATLVGQLDDLTESSGLAVSHLNPGVFWSHNDSGDGPKVYALAEEGYTLVTVTVQGAQAVDWEDMDLGPCGACACLFLADVGDNGLVRGGGTLYRVAEPLVDERALGATATVPLDRALTFVYPDGPHNCETFWVEPRSGIPYLLTKDQDGRAEVFRFPEANPASLPATLVKVADLEFLHHGPLGRVTTGGGMTADGARLAVRTYKEAWEWEVGAGTLADALADEPMHIDLPRRKQGEALTYSPDGLYLYTTSEGEKGLIDRFPCIAGAPEVDAPTAFTTRCASSQAVP